jgi:hypothetical protein
VAAAGAADGVPEKLAPGETVEVAITLDDPRLAAGKWFVGCAVKRGTAGIEIVSLMERATDLLVYGQHGAQAPMGAQHAVRVTTAPAPDAPSRQIA